MRGDLDACLPGRAVGRQAGPTRAGCAVGCCSLRVLATCMHSNHHYREPTLVCTCQEVQVHCMAQPHIRTAPWPHPPSRALMGAAGPSIAKLRMA